MKNLTIAFLLLCSFAVFSQEVKLKETTFDFYGFVRFEAFSDTYKGLNAANEQFFIVPLYAGVDANGKHINQTPTYNFSSMASRLGVRITGPEIFKAKTTANIEADFAGDLGNNPAMLRVRQANAVFTWKTSSLLVGQTWHPFWSGKVFPTVGGLNTGCPFQPFNRSPQVRYDYRPNKRLTLSAALVSEFQYKSYGFSKIDSMYPRAMIYTDKSECFSRNAGIPEMVINIELKGEIEKVVAQIKEVAESFEDEKEEVLNELARIITQLDKPTPKTNIITSALQTINGILMGVAGNMVTPGVIEGIKHVLGLIK